jgi:hypothetical protein
MLLLISLARSQMSESMALFEVQMTLGVNFIYILEAAFMFVNLHISLMSSFSHCIVVLVLFWQMVISEKQIFSEKNMEYSTTVKI